MHRGVAPVSNGGQHLSRSKSAILHSKYTYYRHNRNKMFLDRTHQISMENDFQPDTETEVGVTLNNTVIYNAMIHPLTRMVIRGIIWYQGNYLMKDCEEKYDIINFRREQC
jgi:hypothetical protein